MKIIFQAILYTLIIEIVFFNFHTLSFNKDTFKEKNITIANAIAKDKTQKKKDYIICKHECKIIFPKIKAPIKNLQLHFNGTQNLSFVTISIKDQAEPYNFIKVREFYFSPSDQKTVPTVLHSYGNVSDIELQFSNVGNNFYFSRAIINKVPQFEISIIRSFLIFFFIFWILLSKKYSSVIYDKKNFFHKGILFLIPLLGILFCVYFLNESSSNFLHITNKNISNNNSPSENDIYNKQLNSFLNGNLYIEKASPELLSLNDPYSHGERKVKRVNFPNNYILYKDNIFAPTSIGPIIIFYYPIYLFTGNYPNSEFIIFLTGSLSILFLFLAFIEFVQHFCKQTSLFVISSAGLALIFSSLIPCKIITADITQLDLICGVLFSSATIFFTFKAFNSRLVFSRNILLILAGCCYSLTFASTPLIFLITSAFVFPLLLKRFFRREFFEKNQRQNKLLESVSFFIPLLLGITVQLAYNYLRFNSFFEFGFKYQLTNLNLVNSKLTFTLLPQSLIAYFSNIPIISPTFPFVYPNYFFKVSTGKFILNNFFVGILTFPLNLILIFSTLIIKSRTFHYILLLTFIFSCFIFFYGFSTVGLNINYVFDVNWAIAFISATLLCGLSKYSNNRFDNVINAIILILCISTVIVGGCLTISYNINELVNINPATFIKLQNIF